MEKIDFKKQLKQLYNPSAETVALLEVPLFHYLMIDGRGDPNTSAEYARAVEALYALAYALKFKIKKQGGPDYAVMPLEGLWWVDDMSRFSLKDKQAWQWTMLVMQPSPVSAALFDETLPEVEKKKGLPALSRVRFAPYNEGLAAQVMHIGPYAAEAPTVARIHAFIREQGYQLAGKHHEIYLKDPRKTAPGKLLTVVRQPCQK